MSAATVHKPAPTAETDRERAHRLRAEEATAAREVEEARLDHRRRREVCVEIERSGILVAPEQVSGRTLRPATKPQGKRLRSPEEREVALDEAKQEQLKAARRLTAATERLRRARVALAAYELPELLDAHEVAAERVREADAAAEAAYVALVAALIVRDETRVEEAAKAKAAVRAVSGTLLSDAEREDLRSRGRDEVPASLGSDGTVTTWRGRPVDGLFSLGGQSYEPRNDRFFEALGDVVRGGRARVGGTCGSEKVAARINRALGDERN